MKLLNKISLWLPSALLLLLLIISCDKVTSSSDSANSETNATTNTDSGSNAKMGNFEVRMHDAPAEYDEVNVTVDRVEVKATEGDSTGWQVISKPHQTYNLLELTNGAYTVLGDTTLKAGAYQQIRLVLNEEGNSVVIDSTEYPLKTPSGQQSGLKLNINADIKPDVNYILLLDFDASKSVVRAGKSGKYLLKPVIRATNEAVTGNIQGTVTPVEAKPIVYAIAETDTLGSTIADTTNGNFKLVGLEEGAYTVSVVPRDTSYSTKNVSDINVMVGQTTKLDTVEVAN